MNSRTQNTFSLIIGCIFPAILFLVGFYGREAGGPFYLINRSDPTYTFLFSALNIAEGYSSNFTDIPGLTLQLFNALVIKIYGIIRGAESISEDVLRNPELYLRVIHNSLLGFLTTISLLAGFYIYRISGKIWLMLLLQASWFLDEVTYKKLILVTPDYFVQLSAFIIMTLALILMYRSRSSSNRKDVALFSIIAGFGIATKTVFLPIIFIPLIILRGIKNKLVFLFATLLSWRIWMHAGWENVGFHLRFMQKILTHSGQYGSGEQGLIDLQEMIQNFQWLLMDHGFFFIFLLFISLWVLYRCIRAGSIGQSIEERLMIAVLITQWLGVAMVLKHYGWNYLLAINMLSIIPIALIFNGYKLPGAHTHRPILNLFVAVYAAVWLSNSLIGISTDFRNFRDEKEEALKVASWLNSNGKVELVVHCLASSSIEYNMLERSKGNFLQPQPWDAAIRDIYDEVNWYFIMHPKSKDAYSWHDTTNINLLIDKKPPFYLISQVKQVPMWINEVDTSVILRTKSEQITLVRKRP